VPRSSIPQRHDGGSTTAPAMSTSGPRGLDARGSGGPAAAGPRMARGETLAFVIPWFGPDVPGGAEAVCRDAARALAERGVSVEILTTCARDHASDWIDHHPPGLTAEMGLPVRRFTVRPRDARRFNELNERLLRGELLASWEEREFVANSIHSDDLYAYLAAGRDRYRYAFIPYCFGTTWEGALVAPDRSAVIACLHDEPYARLAATRRVLRDAGAVCFHAGAERALAEALVGPAPDRFGVVGGGVETRIAGDAARFRQKYGLEDPFLLYAGRKSREKNIPLLVEYFTGYRLTHRDAPLKLVLIGPGRLRVSERLAGDVLDLGLLAPEDQYGAYAAALALCQPSILESFSLVMMEAWLCGTPALVHAACPVTREHCLASNGGLFFSDYYEFDGVVGLLLADASLRRALAANGRAYVLENYTWDRVIDNYLEMFGRLGARNSGA
jgi:glycosyltransferase involved in cell wall biosynthesis